MILGILPASRWIDVLRYELHNVSKTLRMLGHIHPDRHKTIDLSTAVRLAEICLLETLAGKMTPIDEKRMRQYVTRRCEEFFKEFVSVDFVEDVAFDEFFESFYSEVLDDTIISMGEMLDMVTPGTVPFTIDVYMRGGNFIVEDLPSRPHWGKRPSQRTAVRKPLPMTRSGSSRHLAVRDKFRLDPATRKFLEDWAGSNRTGEDGEEQ